MLEKTQIQFLAAKRQLFLYGEIDDGDKFAISSSIIYLNSLSKEPITIFIDSPRGPVNLGLEIADIVAASPAPVHGFVTGMASSAGFSVLQACSLRIGLLHAKFFFHAPILSNMSVVISEADKLERDIIELRQIHEEQVTAFARRSGQTKRTWRRWAEKRIWLTAKEALRFHVIDEIADSLPSG